MKKTFKSIISCALATLMVASMASICAFADDESALKVGDAVYINYGAKDVDDNALFRAFYGFDFEVAALEEGVATVTRDFARDDIEAVGANADKIGALLDEAEKVLGENAKVTVSVDVNEADLSNDSSVAHNPYPADEDAEDIEVGSTVAIKFDSKDVNDVEIAKFKSYLDFTVDEINEDVASISAKLDVKELFDDVKDYIAGDGIVDKLVAFLGDGVSADLLAKDYKIDINLDRLVNLEEKEITGSDWRTWQPYVSVSFNDTDMLVEFVVELSEDEEQTETVKELAIYYNQEEQVEFDRVELPEALVDVQYSRENMTVAVADDGTVVMTIPCKDADGNEFEYVYVLTDDKFVLVEDEKLLAGDANADGKVNMEDVVELQKHIAKLITIEGDAFVAADVYADGDLTMLDVTTLQQYKADLLKEIPVVPEKDTDSSTDTDSATDSESESDSATDTEPSTDAEPEA